MLKYFKQMFYKITKFICFCCILWRRKKYIFYYISTYRIFQTFIKFYRINFQSYYRISISLLVLNIYTCDGRFNIHWVLRKRNYAFSRRCSRDAGMKKFVISLSFAKRNTSVDRSLYIIVNRGVEKVGQ